MKKLALTFLAVSMMASAAEMTGYISDAKCAKDPAKAESDAHAACAQGCAKARRVITVVAQKLEVPFERVTATEGRECGRIVVGHRVVHTPNHRQTVHYPRRMGQVLTDARARHTRRDRAELATDLHRGLGLHVEGIDVAGTTVVKDEDARADRLSRSVRAF